MAEDLDKIDARQQHGQTWIKEKEPIVDFCCFCCSLRDGCLIIGWFSMICVMIASFYLIYGIYIMDMINILYFWTDVGSFLMAFLIIGAIVVVFEGVFNGLLLAGTYNKKTKYLKCYLIFFVVRSCLFVVYLLVQMILTGVVVKDLLLQLIGLGLSIYSALVVESYRRVLIKEQGSPTLP